MKRKAPSEALIQQRERLVKLLAPIIYSLRSQEPLEHIKERHDGMLDHATSSGPICPAWGDIPFDYVYRLIGELTMPNLRHPSQEVERLLLSQAGVRIGSGGTSNFSSPVLYADSNPDIREEAESTGVEMLLAAWYYLSERMGLREISENRLADDEYQAQLKTYVNLGDRIVPLLRRSTPERDGKLADSIERTIDTCRDHQQKRKGVS